MNERQSFQEKSMIMAKTEVLKKVLVEKFSEIKKGDLFYTDNDIGQLYKATTDGEYLPETNERGIVSCIPVKIVKGERLSYRE